MTSLMDNAWLSDTPLLGLGFGGEGDERARVYDTGDQARIGHDTLLCASVASVWSLVKRYMVIP